MPGEPGQLHLQTAPKSQPPVLQREPRGPALIPEGHTHEQSDARQSRHPAALGQCHSIPC